MDEVEITVREAFNRCGSFPKSSSKEKSIICLNCKKRIVTVRVIENGERAACSLCGYVLFDWGKEPRSKFMALKRAFMAYKHGQYTEENLLHFFAGFCCYAPTSEDDLAIKEEE